jgi:hypothetical protein
MHIAQSHSTPAYTANRVHLWGPDPTCINATIQLAGSLCLEMGTENVLRTALHQYVVVLALSCRIAKLTVDLTAEQKGKNRESPALYRMRHVRDAELSYAERYISGGIT